MKIIQKHLYIFAFTVALLCVAAYFSPKADQALPRFLIRSPETSKTEAISIYDANDGNYYVFLPSYADLEQVTVDLPQKQRFALGDLSLTDGMDCGSFELEIPYTFSVDHQQTAALWFFRSANVATMYVDTTSGSMKYIHKDKDYKENASVTLYTASGKLDFSQETSKLNGRGNATWEYDKRPYTLTLSTDGSLLDMAPATTWILLANAADETNLNNKLVYDLASRVGMPWTPDCRWVDLYLNGEYSGLYLLTEKVEVHPNRLELDTDSGDFLCRIDLNSRWSSLQNPFLTQAGRTVEISHPKILMTGQQASIEQQVQELEHTILSGTDLRMSPILDLDSWVRRYLLDEISANIDSDLASSYFYCSGGKIFAGPVWDYDMTFGNFPRNQDPHAFIAKNAQKSDINHSAFYSALYNNPTFYDRMVEIYRTQFVPEIQKLLTGELDEAIAFIHKASQSNSLRWRSMYDNLPADVVHTPSALKGYFSNRIHFLNSAWLDNTTYCTIQFESSPGSSYINISVEKGHRLESSYVNTETVVWVDSETEEVVDFSQPILADRILSKQIANDTNSETQSTKDTNRSTSFSAIDCFIFLIMGLILSMIAVFIAIDRVRRRQEQSTAGTHNQV